MKVTARQDIGCDPRPRNLDLSIPSLKKISEDVHYNKVKKRDVDKRIPEKLYPMESQNLEIEDEDKD